MSSNRLMIVTFLLVCLLVRQEMVHGKAIEPNSFKEGELVELKVNKLTSTKNLYPMDYYRLPFCLPEAGIKMDKEYFGDFLAGDRIETSPYTIRMKQDMYCEHLCATNMGREEEE
jgi:transmembrane 9 superfamily protein 2/4